MKLATLVDNGFQQALGRLMSQPMPLRTALKLKKIGARVRAEIDRYESARQEILVRLGSKDEEGRVLLNNDGTVQFSPENFRILAEELNTLGNTEVEIEALLINELGSKVELSPEDVNVIEDILKE